MFFGSGEDHPLLLHFRDEQGPFMASLQDTRKPPIYNILFGMSEERLREVSGTREKPFIPGSRLLLVTKESLS